MTSIPGVYGRSPRVRRPRPVLIGLGTVLLLTVLLAWTRYDPVVGGNVTWCPESGAIRPADIADDAERPSTVCTVVNGDTNAVAFAATVRNSGILPVVVREVRVRSEIEGVFRVEAVRMGVRDDPRLTSYELVSFAPFRLRPGEQRLVEVSGSLTPCEEVTRARVATLHALPLRTSVLGLPHDSEASLDPAIQLVAETC